MDAPEPDDAPPSPPLGHRLAAGFGSRGPRWVRAIVDEVCTCPAGVVVIDLLS